MDETYFGWLFGLEGSVTEPIVLPNLVVRRMTGTERDRICAREVDFFVRDSRIWRNATERFPYLYTKSSSGDPLPIGGEDMVGVLISLLSPGEIRTPIQWTESADGNGAGSSNSEIVSLFFRLINGRYSPIQIETIAPALKTAATRLDKLLIAPASDVLGAVLLDRFIATKAHPISIGPRDSSPHVIARATDTVMMLEYLYHEGSTTEVGFRLGMSVAWVLGATAAERREILSLLKKAYDLRSKRVHGVTTSNKPLTEEIIRAVASTDKLLRRTILARVLAGLNDEAWKNLFVDARIGDLHESFDQVQWVPE